jgi:hypothetical protein
MPMEARYKGNAKEMTEEHFTSADGELLGVFRHRTCGNDKN